MKKYVFFLGSHPALSATEVLTVLKKDDYSPTLTVAAEKILLLKLEKNIDDNFIDKVGGIDRFGKVIGEQDHEWTAEEIVDVLSPAPPKIILGISSIGIPSGYNIKIGKEIKNSLRKKDYKVRFITPTGATQRLNAAQVLFNKLCVPPNYELTFIKSKGKYYLVQTEQVQDIQSYEVRDTSRPARDAKVGMLPPKLAQIMLNLLPLSSSGDAVRILDPFCGMGTILQEGWLMGYTMVGSDASERMVEFSKRNLKWLKQQNILVDYSAKEPIVWQHDVGESFSQDMENTVDAVVTEPFLGEPLSSPLSPKEAEERNSELAGLYAKFLRNIMPVLKPGGGVVMVLPALRQRRGHKSEERGFNLFPDEYVDDLLSIGYSCNQFVPQVLKDYYHTTVRDTLLYARPDALVGREIILFSKNNGT